MLKSVGAVFGIFKHPSIRPMQFGLLVHFINHQLNQIQLINVWEREIICSLSAIELPNTLAGFKLERDFENNPANVFFIKPDRGQIQVWVNANTQNTGDWSNWILTLHSMICRVSRWVLFKQKFENPVIRSGADATLFSRRDLYNKNNFERRWRRQVRRFWCGNTPNVWLNFPLFVGSFFCLGSVAGRRRKTVFWKIVDCQESDHGRSHQGNRAIEILKSGEKREDDFGYNKANTAKLNCGSDNWLFKFRNLKPLEFFKR